MSKDALLEFIKSQIEQDPIGANYNLICKHFQILKILFVSARDLEFLTFFNKMINNYSDIKQALLAENLHEQFNCKVDFIIPNEKMYDIPLVVTYSEHNQFHFLNHSIHNTELLPYIFINGSIRLKGNFNKDYHGLPLIWFGLLNENKKSNANRYGSISFKIKIDKVLEKGSNYFALGTRIYTKERSHTILITNREHVRIQTQLKRKNKYTGEKNLSEFEHDFPRIVNIEQNQLLKKENNEWCLNDGLQLDENLRVNDLYQEWDHAEFCLEANEESVDADDDNNVYAYFDFDDFEICFLEHDYCVKEFKNCNKVKTSRDAKEKFIELIEPEKLFRLRNCFDKQTLQELLELQNQLKKIRLVIDLKLCL